MALRTIQLKFDIQDKVYIEDLDAWGIVLSIYISPLGCEYYVRYFHNGDEKKVYFLDKELRLKK